MTCMARWLAVCQDPIEPFTAVKRTTRAQFPPIVPATILQKKIQTDVESFTITVKLNAISENLSFLLRACVQNEVTGIHKFYRREIWFIGTFHASFSYELGLRKSLNCFKL